ncbi:hypothetical protein P7K49_002727 [Saguinus oedipus]|uniref:Uncharacterized protein n=1 Tax=Saguinus oedipus TaxID=9490 RepID=A0ABQ9WJ40_SAGOE|nr:hypothetical protein P7K49_002727 [Saguinus oedipus]
MRARTLQSPGPGHPALALERSCILQSQKEDTGVSLLKYQAEPWQSLPGEDLELPGAWEGYREKPPAALGEDAACRTCRGPGSQAQGSL